MRYSRVAQDAARQLYGHIDNLELYVGLQAEDCMPLGPGSGICCGYTMTRAILGDAVALVRGDRFYTTAFTPEYLTTWGFHDATTRPDSGGFGAHRKLYSYIVLIRQAYAYISFSS